MFFQISISNHYFPTNSPLLLNEFAFTSQRIRHYYYKNSPLLPNEFAITSHRDEISCRDEMLVVMILGFFEKKPYPSHHPRQTLMYRAFEAREGYAKTLTQGSPDPHFSGLQPSLFGW